MIPEVPQVNYAVSSGDVRIAYEVLGAGDVDVVFALGLVPNLEMSRELPFLRRWLERLSSFSRVVHYDRRGVGLSDRDLSMGSPEERMDDIRAVMDAVGVEQASLVTSVDGGPIALMFVVTFPERVRSLVLYETWACVGWAPDYPVGRREHTLSAHAREHWGDGSTFGAVVGNAPDQDAARDLLARAERTNSSPKVAYQHFELSQLVDVRSILPGVLAPIRLISRPVMGLDELTGWLADALGVPVTELPGAWLHSWDPAYEDVVLDVVEEFLVGAERRAPVQSDRVLLTLLFTDIVDSTRRATELGDREWTHLLARHDAIVRRQLDAHRGRLVKHTGDGAFASFDGPARGVQCARAIVRSAGEAGIPVRAGLHTGECERYGDDIAGLAVHIAARVSALATGGEVLATTTVRELVVGSGLRFEDRGSHELKGIDTPAWQVVAALED